MYVVDRDVLKLVPKNKFFQMPDLIDAVQRRGEEVHVFPLCEKWVDAGSPGGVPTSADRVRHRSTVDE